MLNICTVSLSASDSIRQTQFAIYNNYKIVATSSGTGLCADHDVFVTPNCPPLPGHDTCEYDVIRCWNNDTV